MNKIIAIGVIVAVVVAGAGIYFLNNSSKIDTSMVEKNEAVMTEAQKMEQEKREKDAMMEKKEGETTIKDEQVMMKAGVYGVYSPEKIALAQTENVVLFFKANWCPSCRAVDADIKANLSKIPSKLNILEVNYDTATELKQKYGVTYQHTFVQVDVNGNMLKKWSGSSTLSALVAEVK